MSQGYVSRASIFASPSNASRTVLQLPSPPLRPFLGTFPRRRRAGVSGG